METIMAGRVEVETAAVTDLRAIRKQDSETESGTPTTQTADRTRAESCFRRREGYLSWS